MAETREHPTHCVKGHPAMWCDCKRFVAAPNGTFNTFPMIAYPDPDRLRVVVDPSVPPDEVHVRNHDGRVVGRIVNLAPASTSPAPEGL